MKNNTIISYINSMRSEQLQREQITIYNMCNDTFHIIFNGRVSCVACDGSVTDVEERIISGLSTK